MKKLLCLAVACVGLAGFTSTSALAQNPAGPSSATGAAPSSVGDNGSAPLTKPAATGSSDTTTMKKTHHRHHHRMHHKHHMMKKSSDVTPQKPAAENPKAAPTATPQ